MTPRPKIKSGMYATKTRVPIERTQAEIMRLLLKYGASSQAIFNERGRVAVGFALHGVSVKIVLEPMPDDPQQIKQRWRALLLSLKANLEMIHLGVRTVEQQFMGDLLLSDGKTVSEHVNPQIAAGNLRLLSSRNGK